MFRPAKDALREIAPNVLCVEGHVWFAYSWLPLRMTVLRLGDGSLLVYSPVDPDCIPGAVADMRRLGPVRYIVAPCKTHVQWARTFEAAFPGADLRGCAGKPLSNGDQAFGPDCEHHRMEGLSMFDETVIYHKPSKSLVICDSCFNLKPNDASWPFSFYLRLVDNGPLTLSTTLLMLVNDPARLSHSWRRALDWDIVRVVMAHGDVATGGPGKVKGMLESGIVKQVSDKAQLKARRSVGGRRRVAIVAAVAVTAAWVWRSDAIARAAGATADQLPSYITE